MNKNKKSPYGYKALIVKTCFNPERQQTETDEPCKPLKCFSCGEGVCCESFTMSRDNNFSHLKICEPCGLNEAFTDLARSKEQ